MKKVAIVGVEGSGKTVMLAGLGELYSRPSSFAFLRYFTVFAFFVFYFVPLFIIVVYGHFIAVIVVIAFFFVVFLRWSGKVSCPSPSFTSL